MIRTLIPQRSVLTAAGVRPWVITALLVTIICFVYADPAVPVVSNVTMFQRIDGSKIIDIWYDLYDANGDLCDISLLLSNNGGTTYNVTPDPANLSGDIGNDLPGGNAKHIVWNAGAESFGMEGSYNCQIVAEDGTTALPEGFSLVSGGTFNNGTSNITLSSFLISKYEVTQSSYTEVMGSNPSYFYGQTERPVERVTWLRSMEYCNRRSMQEGLTPAYSYSTYGTNPSNWPAGWYSSNQNQNNFSCNWDADGYRLPTEMEWMFAFRGGNQTENYTYSGSNTLDQVGWYIGNSGGTTHIVGTKNFNELGIHDMSGNVWEWVWDGYAEYPPYALTDPHGPDTATERILRGGSWNNSDFWCIPSVRNHGSVTNTDYLIGFRVARSLP